VATYGDYLMAAHTTPPPSRTMPTPDPPPAGDEQLDGHDRQEPTPGIFSNPAVTRPYMERTTRFEPATLTLAKNVVVSFRPVRSSTFETASVRQVFRPARLSPPR
jgi:hypothetical protein